MRVAIAVALGFAAAPLTPAYAGGDGGSAGYYGDRTYPGANWSAGAPGGDGGHGGDSAALGIGAGGPGGVGPGADGTAVTTNPAQGGGGGGGGATGMAFGFSLQVGADITGGKGGAGGDAGTGAGGGGGGGAGVVTNSGLAVNTSVTIRGGEGGAGGSAEASGGGGGGGAGVIITGTAGSPILLTNAGTITGGAGGIQDNTGSVYSGQGGAGEGGAAGGKGVLLNGAAQGGVGIVAANVMIDNMGVIEGGLASDGTRAAAVEFTGGANQLSLYSPSTTQLLGAIVVDSSATLTIQSNQSGLTIDNALVLGGNAVMANVRPLTWSGTISGDGALNKTGTGTLTLAGANTYAGGTVVHAGAVAVSSDTNLGSGPLTLDGGALATTASFATARAVTLGAAGGTFETATGTTLQLNGGVDGTGGLTKTGAGTLVMTGANTYTGTSVIAAGTLQTSAANLPGDVVDNGVLVLNETADVTYARTISGTGLLTKQGLGQLTMTGDSSSYAGNTVLSGGGLQVTGSLGGNIDVGSGTVLSGTGSVGTITIGAGGTLEPGSNAIVGTLTVNGDLNFAPGAIYRVRTDAAGARDSVHVTGSATLAGSVLNVGQDGNYAASTRYGILDADGGIRGSFQGVSSNLAYLTPSLVYGVNTVDLQMDMKQIPDDDGGGGTRTVRFADYATNHNQRVTADALQSLPGSSSLYSRVLNLGEDEPASVFASLSGEVHATTLGSLQNVADRVSSLPLSHLQANLDASSLPGPATAQLGGGDASSLPQTSARPIWAQVFGSWRNQSGSNGTVSTSESESGIFIGGDQAVGNGWRVGGALGYTDSQTRLHDLSSRSSVDSYSAAVYGGKAFEVGPGKINLSLGAAYTWHDLKTKRDADAAGIGQKLESSYGASTGQLFGELGYAAPLNDRVTLEPFVGVGYADLRTRGFSESGGDAALNGESERNHLAAVTVGLHAKSTFESAGAAGNLRATLGWRHAYGNVDPEATLAFQGSQTFTVTGAPIARDSAVVELSVDMAVTKRTTVGLNYGGQFSSGTRRNTGSLDVKWHF